MKDTWSLEIARIQAAVPLPVRLESCPADTWDAYLACLAAEGCEVVRHHRTGDTVWCVVIQPADWPEPARALLDLVLSRPDAYPASTDSVITWLRSAYDGRPVELPGPLGRSWTEPKACFVLERAKRGGPYPDWAAWHSLFHDFFSGRRTVALHPLSPETALLMVPLSQFPDMAPGAEGRTQWLEWAASLHDVMSTELLERVRVWVSEPVMQPSDLVQALFRMRRLAIAVQRYGLPVMASGTWQYQLEQWAAAIEPDTAAAVARSLPADCCRGLTPEQRETLDALFRHNLNVSETARALYVHRNTLLYRLDRIRDRTGLDPREFADAMLLRLALLFGQSD